jgi:hypothetical protein
MTGPAPHTKGKLLAGSLDMAEFLAVVNMRWTSLLIVSLHTECNMAKASKFYYLTGHVRR